MNNYFEDKMENEKIYEMDFFVERLYNYYDDEQEKVWPVIFGVIGAAAFVVIVCLVIKGQNTRNLKSRKNKNGK